MDKEFSQLRSLLGDVRKETRHNKSFVTGTLNGTEVVLQKCGIGKVNSAVGAVEMIDGYQPDIVVSSGCAGGADVSLNPLDIVVASECVYHDVYCGESNAFGQIQGMPARYKAPAELIEKALSINEANHKSQNRIVSGLTVSGDWFVDSREKMQTILDRFPDAEAVDMESCSIAQVCHIYDVPFVSFRVISDVPLKDNNASQYFDFWDNVADNSFAVIRSFLALL